MTLVVLAGCGFRPLYSGGSRGVDATPADLASIAIEPIADRGGQQLHNKLLDLLTPRGRPTWPRYTLVVEMQQSINRLAARKSEFATRAALNASATFSLLRHDDNRTVFAGRSLAATSFNILASEFATLIAERDARRQVVRELGEDIHTRIAVYFTRKRGEPPQARR